MRSKVGLIVIGIVFAAVLGTLLFQSMSSKPNPSGGTTKTLRIIPIETVVESPASFKGLILVSGTVVRVDQPNISFSLGCCNICVSMPVIYSGRSPKVGANVILSGQIQNAGGKYIFEAQEIKHGGT